MLFQEVNLHQAVLILQEMYVRLCHSFLSNVPVFFSNKDFSIGFIIMTYSIIRFPEASLEAKGANLLLERAFVAVDMDAI